MAQVLVRDIEAGLAREGFDFLRWDEWWGRPGDPTESWAPQPPFQVLPANRIYTHHSVTPATAKPADAARTINRIGVARFGRMSYPFLIHHSGVIIQGCYPYLGAHTRNQNSTSLAACHIGNYDTIVPSQIQVEANGALIRVLRALGALINIPGIAGHRDAPGASTACPGKFLYAKVPEIARLGMKDLTPLPPAPSPTQEDDMFSYEHGTKLILVAGGKRVRLTGQEILNRRRQSDQHLGVVGDDEELRFAEAWGPVIG